MNAHAAAEPEIPERAVAVVGMSGRFPGAADLAEYWTNLRDGVCSLRDFTPQELAADGLDPAEAADPAYVPSKGYLEDADRFEAELFGFTLPQAAALDPQHRLLLQTAWSALEDAGYDPRAVPLRTGVYVGGGSTEHMIAAAVDRGLAGDLGALNIRLLTDKDFLASWISYRLGLDGPSMAVQTACSTSLTAVHVAVQALLLGECDAALAGGVAVDHLRREGYLYQSGGITSRDGRCRPFAADADGTVRGNGAGLVMLRRLEDALDDGDPVRAVIRGSALTNDGSAKIGFTAPGVEGQIAAMSEALAAAGVEPGSVGYIEMHGTATALGDRIEVAATAAAYSDAGTGITIGSVKANIGHLDAAAGIAGLIKTVLMLQHRTIVPLPGVAAPNPELKLAQAGLRLATEPAAWPSDGAAPRRAGVSSVGLGGSNVHVILEEAPRAADSGQGSESAPSGHVSLLPISARTSEQAATLAASLAEAISADPRLRLADVAHTLQVSRLPLAARGYVLAADRAEAVDAIRASAASARYQPVSVDEDTDSYGCVFVFPGQASQYGGMGRELYAQHSAFRDAMDRCARILTASHGIDPRSWAPQHGNPVTDILGRTDYWQPTIVSVEYATAVLLRELAIEPAATVGHSIGEYTAACLAGVLDLDDALQLVAERGRLMSATEPGAMLAVFAGEEQVRPLLTADIDIAAANGPDACVVSGDAAKVRSLAGVLDSRGISHRDLNVQYGFHSSLMDGVVEEFARIAAQVTLHAADQSSPRYVSTVTGAWASADQATDPRMWAQQIRGPVLFGAAMAAAQAAHPAAMVLEVGPGVALSGHVRRSRPGTHVLATLGRGGDEPRDLLRAVGELWSRGRRIEWSALGEEGRRVHLPTYPFAGASHGAMTLRALTSVAVSSEAQGPGARLAEVPQPAEPGTPADRIAALLRETLGVAEPDDRRLSYLAAGGESLTAVHLVGRLREEFGLEAPLALLLEPIPLRELADRLVAEASAAGDLLAALLDEFEAAGPESRDAGA
ncbi:type I polyketide synthase [Actinospica robiniae]|uniref:type I polyketide synthase n=1 Tax=Actinospica robiniae TaxID=304901 RepID=UPI000429A249|nr:type I polyketide synthase [Actinospica robiniae]